MEQNNIFTSALKEIIEEAENSEEMALFISSCGLIESVTIINMQQDGSLYHPACEYATVMHPDKMARCAKEFGRKVGSLIQRLKSEEGEAPYVESPFKIAFDIIKRYPEGGAARGFTRLFMMLMGNIPYTLADCFGPLDSGNLAIAKAMVSRYLSEGITEETQSYGFQVANLFRELRQKEENQNDESREENGQKIH